MALFQFVDSISASPTVRLDLNSSSGGLWIGDQGLDLSPAPLRRAVVSTMLVDGDHIPATAWGNRVLKLPLQLMQATVDTAATALQQLARELARERNILRVQLGSASYFFRTFAAPDYAFSMPKLLAQYGVAMLEIPAEPFAYGVKETLPQVTVNNNPAAGSNGMFFDVTGVKGDVETPLNLQVTRGGSPDLNGLISCMAVRRRGTPSSMPFVLQAESMTADTDTSLQANSATYSGAGSNYMRCTFGTTAAMATRVHSALYPAVAAVDARGTYRVFARVAKTVAGDNIKVQLGYGAGSVSFGWEVNLNDAVTLGLGTTAPVWVDLGLVSIPVGSDPIQDGYSNTDIAAGGIGISLQAQRVSGTGNLDMDVLLWMPADDRLAFVEYANINVAGLDFEIVDSVHDSVWTQEAGAVFSNGTLTAGSFVGGLPLIWPGVTNRICWLAVANGNTLSDSLAYTTVITPSYWPRYLNVKPVST